MDFKNQYFNKANDLFERLLDEADELPATVDELVDVPDESGDAEDTTETPDETEEPEQPKKETEFIEIYFSNLDEEAQKKVLDSLKQASNAAENDTYTEQRIVESMKSKPIFMIRGSDLKRQLNIDV